MLVCSNHRHALLVHQYIFGREIVLVIISLFLLITFFSENENMSKYSWIYIITHKTIWWQAWPSCWINYMKHCFSLPEQNFTHASLYQVDDIVGDSTDWLSKMKNVTMSPNQGDDVESSVQMPYSNQLLHVLCRTIICLDTNQHGYPA